MAVTMVVIVFAVVLVVTAAVIVVVLRERDCGRERQRKNCDGSRSKPGFG
jgi:hypothetical protein